MQKEPQTSKKQMTRNTLSEDRNVAIRMVERPQAASINTHAGAHQHTLLVCLSSSTGERPRRFRDTPSADQAGSLR